MKGFDYSVVRDRKVYNVLMPLAITVSHFMCKVKYEGVENVPKQGGFIMASNHVTALDPVHIGSRFPRPIHYMSKQEAFDSSGFVKWFFKHMNAFPVKRGGSDKSSVEYAIKLVQSGCVLGIFPEGKRSKDCQLAPAKSGVALIAKAAHADILPVSIYVDKKKKWRTKLTLRFGKLIPYSELGLSDAERSAHELKEASRIIMERIGELWEKGHIK